MKDAPPQKLVFIKMIHTLVWGVFVSAIGYVWWSGVTGNINLYSWIAVGAVCFEGLILIIFDGSCPLTKIARKYSNSSRDNFDIFLPEWLARYNKRLFTPIFLIGLAIMIFRML